MRHFAIFLLIFVAFVYSVEAGEEPIDYRNNLKQVSDKINQGNLKNYELHGIQNQLERMQYQSQFLELYNLAMNIDTDNKVLREKLDVQQKYFETALKEQQHQYEVELNHQTMIYQIAFGGLTLFGLMLGFFGPKIINKQMKKLVKDEHGNAINEITEKLSNNDELKRRIESLVTIAMRNQTSGESFDGDIQ